MIHIPNIGYYSYPQMLFAGYSAAGPTGLNAIGPAYQLLRAFRNDVAA